MTPPDSPQAGQTWTVEFDDRARRELRKLDVKSQKDILRYLRLHVAGSIDPRQFGKPLRMNLAGLWRYRVGDYRLICRLEEGRLVVLVIKAGHC